MAAAKRVKKPRKPPKIRMLWTCSWLLEGDRFFAYGTNQEKLRVYEVLRSGLRKTKMTFPSCMKFIVPDKLGRVIRRSPSFVQKRYGPILTRELVRKRHQGIL